jgi:hypothetical protein
VRNTPRGFCMKQASVSSADQGGGSGEARSSGLAFAAPTPFRLALNRGGCRVLDLKPMVDAA